jgi:hypothetical protein
VWQRLGLVLSIALVAVIEFIFKGLWQISLFWFYFFSTFGSAFIIGKSMDFSLPKLICKKYM